MPEAIGRQASLGLFSDDGLLAAAGRSESIGVIAVNDGVAFGLMHTAEEAGKKPGVDFALLGFDDHPNSRMVGLTSLRLPFDAMGKEAARLLLSSLRKEQISTQVRLGWNLIPRETTRSTRLTVSGDR
jgi:DNA-binding LacI/PurR family transcriptional regulator